MSQDKVTTAERICVHVSLVLVGIFLTPLYLFGLLIALIVTGRRDLATSNGGAMRVD